MAMQNITYIDKKTTNLRAIFGEWLIERKEFIVPFFVLFVIVDPLITYIGTNAFKIDEGNFIVSSLVENENGWVIWLVLKIIFGLVGTMFMFSAYYMIKTEKLTEIEKKKVIMFEYGAWSFLLCFIFITILHWASTIIIG